MSGQRSAYVCEFEVALGLSSAIGLIGIDHPRRCMDPKVKWDLSFGCIAIFANAYRIFSIPGMAGRGRLCNIDMRSPTVRIGE